MFPQTQSWQPSATLAQHFRYLMCIKQSQILLLLLLAFVAINSAFMSSSQTCFGPDEFPPSLVLKTDVECWFLGGREAPRCSRGEIYASSSCRNADSPGNQNSAQLHSWWIDTVITSPLSSYRWLSLAHVLAENRPANTVQVLGIKRTEPDTSLLQYQLNVETVIVVIVITSRSRSGLFSNFSLESSVSGSGWEAVNHLLASFLRWHQSLPFRFPSHMYK